MKHWTLEVEGIRTLVTVYDAENEEEALVCFEQEPSWRPLRQQLMELFIAEDKPVCDEGAKYRIKPSLPEESENFETIFKAEVAADKTVNKEKEGYVIFLIPIYDAEALVK
jgi:hypothetical protein